jgi:phage tail-like protein
VSNSVGQLIIRLNGEVIQTLSLNTAVIRIGRSPENELSLSHQMVSRIHAELRMTPQGLMLTDLGSFNGTFIETQRLLPNQPQLLDDSMIFRIGPFLLTYQVAQPAVQQEKCDDEVIPIDEEHTIVLVPVATEAAPPPIQSVPQSIEPVYGRAYGEADGIYTRFLPDIFQENDFLRRFLHIFEDIWEPLEQRQDHIEMYFDPYTCPVSFLPWLTSWLGLPFNPHWPEARHRRLLAQCMEIYNWRGTRYGLACMIEVCTGLTPVIKESTGQPFVFHISIALPAGDAGNRVDKNLIEELIRVHKPAYAGYILEVIS